MTKLHIIQGGIENGDKEWLTRASQDDLESSWTAPKNVEIDDEVVVHVDNHGLFATGVVLSRAKKSTHRTNRYRARIGRIRLLNEPLPISVLREKIEALSWARYPRSYTTPSDEIADQIRELIKRKGYKQPLLDADEYESGIEGKKMLRQHFVSERDPRLSKSKKDSALRTNGRLICEVCGFDFNLAYGKRGVGYCEVHHKMPLSNVRGAVKVKLSDLAIVCSNCHRMLHRKPFLSVGELKRIVNQQRKPMPSKA
jgi:5-methylcytosine-specific restriction endonuclease McrA